jgi:DNA polymerase-3 subunit epsilon
MSAPVTVEVAAYLDVLDRALEDRHLSNVEQDELGHVATMLRFTADQVRRIHADYLGTLIALAYRDGVVTDRERADLDLVAEVLGIDGIDDALAQLASARSSTSTGGGEHSLAGLNVCFTGTLLCSHNGRPITRDDAHQLATSAGMSVATSVTKKLDVLVVADPDSLSGKAQKARQYGTRIIAETAFWPMIGVEVD